MNILYINHYAGSPEYGMEFRPYHLAIEWMKKGHNVRILAASYSHVRSKQPSLNGNRIVSKQTEWIEGIEYIWYPTPEYGSNGLGRVKNIFTFLARVWCDASKQVQEFSPDVVIASSTYPMDIWVAHRIAKKAKAKLVYEVHDLWPLSPIEIGGMSPKHPFIRVCQWAEDYAYKHSDVVVSMLPKVHEHMVSHGLDLSKLVIIPNGIVKDAWMSRNQEALSNYQLDFFLRQQHELGNIIVGYAGSLGKPNAMEYFLKATDELREERIVFVIVGSGLEKDNLEKQKAFLQAKNVFFFDPIHKTEIPSLLARFDIAYIASQKSPLYRFGVSPNKLMDYMMAGLPIVSSIEAGNNPVADAGCGVTAEVANPKDIASKIREIAQLTPQERQAMGKRGQEYVLREHTYTVLADKFLKALEK